jgi:hypothetical protein
MSLSSLAITAQIEEDVGHSARNIGNDMKSALSISFDAVPGHSGIAPWDDETIL